MCEWVSVDCLSKICVIHKGFIFICSKSMVITRTQNQITMPPADLICGNLRMTEMINVFVAFFFIDDFFIIIIIIIKFIIIYAWPLYLWFSISNRILFNKSVVYLYAYIQKCIEYMICSIFFIIWLWNGTHDSLCTTDKRWK